MDPYQLTFNTYNKIAELYQEKFMDLDLYDDTYDAFCNLITKKDPAIFEIGCGPGNITRYLLQKRPDFRIEATDAAPNMVKLAQENNPAADCKVMDCRGLHLLTKKYDGIVCGFCVPYLSKEDCAKLLKDAATLLNSGGVLYFSAVEGDYDKSGMETNSKGDQVFFYYHEVSYLLEGLQVNGFELEQLIRKDYPQPGKVLSTHMIFIALRK
jgi:cyclopropane fatty-acyl-phospholipid synthase-like methyltransferase